MARYANILFEIIKNIKPMFRDIYSWLKTPQVNDFFSEFPKSEAKDDTMMREYFKLIWDIHLVVFSRCDELDISTYEYCEDIAAWNTIFIHLQTKRQEPKDFREAMLTLIDHLCQIDELAEICIRLVNQFIATEDFTDLKEYA